MINILIVLSDANCNGQCRFCLGNEIMDQLNTFSLEKVNTTNEYESIADMEKLKELEEICKKALRYVLNRIMKIIKNFFVIGEYKSAISDSHRHNGRD